MVPDSGGGNPGDTDRGSGRSNQGHDQSHRPCARLVKPQDEKKHYGTQIVYIQIKKFLFDMTIFRGNNDVSLSISVINEL